MNISTSCASKLYIVLWAAIFVMTMFNAVAIGMRYYWFATAGLFTTPNPSSGLTFCRCLVSVAVFVISVTSVTECVWVCCTPCPITRIKWLRFITLLASALGFAGCMASFWQLPAEEGTDGQVGVLGLTATIFFCLTGIFASLITLFCYDWTRYLTALTRNSSFTAAGMVQQLRANMRRLRTRYRHILHPATRNIYIPVRDLDAPSLPLLDDDSNANISGGEEIDTSSGIFPDREDNASITSGSKITGEKRDETALSSETVLQPLLSNTRNVFENPAFDLTGEKEDETALSSESRTAVGQSPLSDSANTYDPDLD